MLSRNNKIKEVIKISDILYFKIDNTKDSVCLFHLDIIEK